MSTKVSQCAKVYMRLIILALASLYAFVAAVRTLGRIDRSTSVSVILFESCICLMICLPLQTIVMRAASAFGHEILLQESAPSDCQTPSPTSANMEGQGCALLPICIKISEVLSPPASYSHSISRHRAAIRATVHSAAACTQDRRTSRVIQPRFTNPMRCMKVVTVPKCVLGAEYSDMCE